MSASQLADRSVYEGFGFRADYKAVNQIEESAFEINLQNSKPTTKITHNDQFETLLIWALKIL